MDYKYASEAQKERLDKAAISSVGHALLFHFSPRGGSYGGDLDIKRAAKLVEDGISGEELHAFLIDVARETAAEAFSELSRMQQRFIEEARVIAERSDSLSLHQFIEKYAADEKEKRA